MKRKFIKGIEIEDRGYEIALSSDLDGGQRLTLYRDEFEQVVEELLKLVPGAAVSPIEYPQIDVEQELEARDKWQEVTVDPKGAGHTYRLRVPGGWLYRTVSYRYPELHAEWEVSIYAERGEWEDENRRETDRAVEIVATQQTFVPDATT